MENNALILVVDDDPVNLKITQSVFAKAGYRVAATLSGAQALTLFGKATPSLVLLDVNMPEMDGFETLENIRALENGETVPVLFLTGEAEGDIEDKCLQAGAMGLVSKPVNAATLLDRVANI